MKTAQTRDTGSQLAIALLTLMTNGKTREARRRIKALSFVEHTALMRAVVSFDLAVFDGAAGKWVNSEYWLRGVDIPADESKAQRALPGRRAGD